MPGVKTLGIDRLEHLRGVAVNPLDVLRRVERTLTVLTVPSAEAARAWCRDLNSLTHLNDILRDLWNVTAVIYNTIQAHDGHHLT